MKNARWIGGIILMLAAAGLFFFNGADNYLPASIVLLIVGISLVATTRKAQA